VNKFLGDGFLALFGAALDDPAAAANALAAGREMLMAVDTWNAAHPKRALKVGIGVHIGEAITGSIGSPGVWPETLRFLAHSGIDLSSIVTEHFDVEAAVEALETAHHPTPTTIKAHIELTGSL